MKNQFFQNLFGTIAGGAITANLPANISFIPTDSAEGTLDIKNNQSVWLGLRNRLMQKYAYEYCYPLASVVDKLAEYDITGIIKINRSTGKGKDNEATNPWSVRMRLLLQQPNPLQTWAQFRGQQVVYKKIFGFCPVLPVVPSGFTPEFCTAMINLPPWLFSATSTRSLLFESRIQDIVKQYHISILGGNTNFNPEDIFILEDSFMQDESTDFLLPLSRLVGLDMAVSNICAAMEADNVLLRKKGPLGFISHDAAAVKDSVAGYQPMSKKERDEVQNSLQRYGMTWHQFQYVISRTALKWNAMSFDVKQLGTKETIAANEEAVCHRMGLPYVLYKETDTSYANGATAKKGVYEDNVIPNNSKDLQKYNKFFQAEENNCKIVGDFSEASAFQEDEKFKGQALQAMATGLQIQWVNNVITLNQWRTAQNIDTTPDGDVYYKDIVQQQQTNNQNGNTQENQGNPNGSGAAAN